MATSDKPVDVSARCMAHQQDIKSNTESDSSNFLEQVLQMPDTSHPATRHDREERS